MNIGDRLNSEVSVYQVKVWTGDDATVVFESVSRLKADEKAETLKKAGSKVSVTIKR